MNLRFCLLPLLLIAATSFQALAEEKGFVSLFDGKSLQGWEGKQSMFRVEDGAIVAGTLAKKIPNNEFLSTKKRYDNFELRLEAKLKGTNAGIQFRSERIPNHHEMKGYQCDMGGKASGPIWGWLYDESRRRTFLVKQQSDEYKKAVDVDGWNKFVIRCQGPRIQIWVNDFQVVDYTEADAKIPQTGIIGLQIHSGPAAEASYRNIRIKAE